MFLASTSFIPLSIPIATKKKKTTSVNKTRKTVHNDNHNASKIAQINSRSSHKEKKSGQSDVIVSPSIRPSKRNSVNKLIKTKNKENYDNGHRSRL